MMPTQISGNRPIRILENILSEYWIKNFNNAKGKWKIVEGEPGVEGECHAIITTLKGETYEGYYQKGLYHAEMAAWVNYSILGDDDDKIQKIEISSPPCPKCAVVLELLGLSNLVYAKNRVSRMGPSGNWCDDNQRELIKKITDKSPLTESEISAHAGEIYRYFRGGGWE